MIDIHLASPWLWASIGAICITAEMILPGFFMIWIGLGCIATSLIATLTFWSSPVLLIAWSLVTVLLVMLGKKYQKRLIQSTYSKNTLNQRYAQLIGQVFTLESDIINNKGTVRIGDSIWAAQGPNLPKGSHVIVLNVVGNHLIVQEYKNDSTKAE